jgi:hypothetical protein
LTARSSETTLLNRTNSGESSTGIKIRMKGYGAIVDNSSGGGGQQNALPNSVSQPANNTANTHNTTGTTFHTELKL